MRDVVKRKGVVFTLTAVAFGLLGMGATVDAQEVRNGRARLHPVNQSGAKGQMTFVEDEEGVTVTGSALGLEPSTVGRYISLVYDLGSVPGGPEGCEPTVILPNMFVGIWATDADGIGMLVQTAEIEPLGTFDSVSIRDTTINGGIGPDAVVACGQVALTP